MLSYKDKTFCVSDDCNNDCDRKLTDEIKEGAKKSGLPLSVGYFCGLPEWWNKGNYK
jgi:hypothetical protein